jgi:hypothetical protein
VCAEEETNLISAHRETVDLDGEFGGDLGCDTEAGFAELEVVVGLDAEAEREERGVVDRLARLDDEILEEDVDFRCRHFEARNGNVLNVLDEERDEYVDAVVDQILVGQAVLWR